MIAAIVPFDMNQQDIMVGVDFSESSKAALKEAGHIAALRKGWLNIVHVIDRKFFERELDEKYLTERQLKKQAEDALSKFALKAFGASPSMRFFVFVGNPFEELLNKAESLKCDLLVLGSYGNSGKSDHVGTTAARFVRKTAIPVLLVREGQRTPFKNIVACYDFSETSQRALDYAAEMANAHAARLHVLHNYSTYVSLGIYGEIPALPPSYLDAEVARLEAKLQELLEPIRETYPKLDIKLSVIQGGLPASAIYDYVNEINADLTVLGTRGRTGFKKLLLGTTAEHLVHKCPSSVLAVKPADLKE